MGLDNLNLETGNPRKDTSTDDKSTRFSAALNNSASTFSLESADVTLEGSSNLYKGDKVTLPNGDILEVVSIDPGKTLILRRLSDDKVFEVTEENGLVFDEENGLTYAGDATPKDTDISIRLDKPNFVVSKGEKADGKVVLTTMLSPNDEGMSSKVDKIINGDVDSVEDTDHQDKLKKSDDGLKTITTKDNSGKEKVVKLTTVETQQALEAIQKLKGILGPSDIREITKLESYLLGKWDALPNDNFKPRRLAFKVGGGVVATIIIKSILLSLGLTNVSASVISLLLGLNSTWKLILLGVAQEAIDAKSDRNLLAENNVRNFPEKKEFANADINEILDGDNPAEIIILGSRGLYLEKTSETPAYEAKSLLADTDSDSELAEFGFDIKAASQKEGRRGYGLDDVLKAQKTLLSKGPDALVEKTEGYPEAIALRQGKVTVKLKRTYVTDADGKTFIAYVEDRTSTKGLSRKLVAKIVQEKLQLNNTPKAERGWGEFAGGVFKGIKKGGAPTKNITIAVPATSVPQPYLDGTADDVDQKTVSDKNDKSSTGVVTSKSDNSISLDEIVLPSMMDQEFTGTQASFEKATAGWPKVLVVSSYYGVQYILKWDEETRKPVYELDWSKLAYHNINSDTPDSEILKRAFEARNMTPPENYQAATTAGKTLWALNEIQTVFFLEQAKALQVEKQPKPDKKELTETETDQAQLAKSQTDDSLEKKRTTSTQPTDDMLERFNVPRSSLVAFQNGTMASYDKFSRKYPKYIFLGDSGLILRRAVRNPLSAYGLKTRYEIHDLQYRDGSEPIGHTDFPPSHTYDTPREKEYESLLSKFGITRSEISYHTGVSTGPWYIRASKYIGKVQDVTEAALKERAPTTRPLNLAENPSDFSISASINGKSTSTLSLNEATIAKMYLNRAGIKFSAREEGEDNFIVIKKNAFGATDEEARQKIAALRDEFTSWNETLYPDLKQIETSDGQTNALISETNNNETAKPETTQKNKTYSDGDLLTPVDLPGDQFNYIRFQKIYVTDNGKSVPKYVIDRKLWQSNPQGLASVLIDTLKAAGFQAPLGVGDLFTHLFDPADFPQEYQRYVSAKMMKNDTPSFKSDIILPPIKQTVGVTTDASQLYQGRLPEIIEIKPGQRLKKIPFGVLPDRKNGKLYTYQYEIRTSGTQTNRYESSTSDKEAEEVYWNEEPYKNAKDKFEIEYFADQLGIDSSEMRFRINPNAPAVNDADVPELRGSFEVTDAMVRTILQKNISEPGLFGSDFEKAARLNNLLAIGKTGLEDGKETELAGGSSIAAFIRPDQKSSAGAKTLSFIYEGLANGDVNVIIPSGDEQTIQRVTGRKVYIYADGSTSINEPKKLQGQNLVATLEAQANGKAKLLSVNGAVLSPVENPSQQQIPGTFSGGKDEIESTGALIRSGDTIILQKGNGDIQAKTLIVKSVTETPKNRQIILVDEKNQEILSNNDEIVIGYDTDGKIVFNNKNSLKQAAIKYVKSEGENSGHYLIYNYVGAPKVSLSPFTSLQPVKTNTVTLNDGDQAFVSANTRIRTDSSKLELTYKGVRLLNSGNNPAALFVEYSKPDGQIVYAHGLQIYLSDNEVSSTQMPNAKGVLTLQDDFRVTFEPINSTATLDIPENGNTDAAQPLPEGLTHFVDRGTNNKVVVTYDGTTVSALYQKDGVKNSNAEADRIFITPTGVSTEATADAVGMVFMNKGNAYYMPLVADERQPFYIEKSVKFSVLGERTLPNIDVLEDEPVEESKAPADEMEELETKGEEIIELGEIDAPNKASLNNAASKNMTRTDISGNEFVTFPDKKFGIRIETLGPSRSTYNLNVIIDSMEPGFKLSRNSALAFYSDGTAKILGNGIRYDNSADFVGLIELDESGKASLSYVNGEKPILRPTKPLGGIMSGDNQQPSSADLLPYMVLTSEASPFRMNGEPRALNLREIAETEKKNLTADEIKNSKLEGRIYKLSSSPFDGDGRMEVFGEDDVNEISKHFKRLGIENVGYKVVGTAPDKTNKYEIYLGEASLLKAANTNAETAGIAFKEPPTPQLVQPVSSVQNTARILPFRSQPLSIVAPKLSIDLRNSAREAKFWFQGKEYHLNRIAENSYKVLDAQGNPAQLSFTDDKAENIFVADLQEAGLEITIYGPEWIVSKRSLQNLIVNSDAAIVFDGEGGSDGNIALVRPKPGADRVVGIKRLSVGDDNSVNENYMVELTQQQLDYVKPLLGTLGLTGGKIERGENKLSSISVPNNKIVAPAVETSSSNKVEDNLLSGSGEYTAPITKIDNSKENTKELKKYPEKINLTPAVDNFSTGYHLERMLQLGSAQRIYRLYQDVPTSFWDKENGDLYSGLKNSLQVPLQKKLNDAEIDEVIKAAKLLDIDLRKEDIDKGMPLDRVPSSLFVVNQDDVPTAELVMPSGVKEAFENEGSDDGFFSGSAEYTTPVSDKDAYGRINPVSTTQLKAGAEIYLPDGASPIAASRLKIKGIEKTNYLTEQPVIAAEFFSNRTMTTIKSQQLYIYDDQVSEKALKGKTYLAVIEAGADEKITLQPNADYKGSAKLGIGYPPVQTVQKSNEEKVAVVKKGLASKINENDKASHNFTLNDEDLVLIKDMTDSYIVFTTGDKQTPLSLEAAGEKRILGQEIVTEDNLIKAFEKLGLKVVFKDGKLVASGDNARAFINGVPAKEYALDETLPGTEKGFSYKLVEIKSFANGASKNSYVLQKYKDGIALARLDVSTDYNFRVTAEGDYKFFRIDPASGRIVYLTNPGTASYLNNSGAKIAPSASEYISQDKVEDVLAGTNYFKPRFDDGKLVLETISVSSTLPVKKETTAGTVSSKSTVENGTQKTAALDSFEINGQRLEYRPAKESYLGYALYDDGKQLNEENAKRIFNEKNLFGLFKKSGLTLNFAGPGRLLYLGKNDLDGFLTTLPDIKPVKNTQAVDLADFNLSAGLHQDNHRLSWILYNDKGERYFLKRATKNEFEKLQLADSQRADYASRGTLFLPEIIQAGDEKLINGLNARAQEAFRETDNSDDETKATHGVFVITKEMPAEVDLYSFVFKNKSLPRQVTLAEFDQIIGEVKRLKDVGLEHGDIMHNLFLNYDKEKDKVYATIIGDFSSTNASKYFSQVLNQTYQWDDIAFLEGSKAKLIEQDRLTFPTVKNSNPVNTLSANSLGSVNELQDVKTVDDKKLPLQKDKSGALYVNQDQETIRQLPKLENKSFWNATTLSKIGDVLDLGDYTYEVTYKTKDSSSGKPSAFFILQEKKNGIIQNRTVTMIANDKLGVDEQGRLISFSSYSAKRVSTPIAEMIEPKWLNISSIDNAGDLSLSVEGSNGGKPVFQPLVGSNAVDNSSQSDADIKDVIPVGGIMSGNSTFSDELPGTNETKSDSKSVEINAEQRGPITPVTDTVNNLLDQRFQFGQPRNLLSFNGNTFSEKSEWTSSEREWIANNAKPVNEIIRNEFSSYDLIAFGETHTPKGQANLDKYFKYMRRHGAEFLFMEQPKFSSPYTFMPDRMGNFVARSLYAGKLNDAKENKLGLSDFRLSDQAEKRFSTPTYKGLKTRFLDEAPSPPQQDAWLMDDFDSLSLLRTKRAQPRNQLMARRFDSILGTDKKGAGSFGSSHLANLYDLRILSSDNPTTETFDSFRMSKPLQEFSNKRILTINNFPSGLGISSKTPLAIPVKGSPFSNLFAKRSTFVESMGDIDYLIIGPYTGNEIQTVTPTNTFNGNETNSDTEFSSSDAISNNISLTFAPVDAEDKDGKGPHYIVSNGERLTVPNAAKIFGIDSSAADIEQKVLEALLKKGILAKSGQDGILLATSLTQSENDTTSYNIPLGSSYINPNDAAVTINVAPQNGRTVSTSQLSPSLKTERISGGTTGQLSSGAGSNTVSTNDVTGNQKMADKLPVTNKTQVSSQQTVAEEGYKTPVLSDTTDSPAVKRMQLEKLQVEVQIQRKALAGSLEMNKYLGGSETALRSDQTTATADLDGALGKLRFEIETLKSDAARIEADNVRLWQLKNPVKPQTGAQTDSLLTDGFIKSETNPAVKTTPRLLTGDTLDSRNFQRRTAIELFKPSNDGTDNPFSARRTQTSNNPFSVDEQTAPRVFNPADDIVMREVSDGKGGTVWEPVVKNPFALDLAEKPGVTGTLTKPVLEVFSPKIEPQAGFKPNSLSAPFAATGVLLNAAAVASGNKTLQKTANFANAGLVSFDLANSGRGIALANRTGVTLSQGFELAQTTGRFATLSKFATPIAKVGGYVALPITAFESGYRTAEAFGGNATSAYLESIAPNSQASWLDQTRRNRKAFLSDGQTLSLGASLVFAPALLPAAVFTGLKLLDDHVLDEGDLSGKAVNVLAKTANGTKREQEQALDDYLGMATRYLGDESRANIKSNLMSFFKPWDYEYALSSQPLINELSKARPDLSLFDRSAEAEQKRKQAYVGWMNTLGVEVTVEQLSGIGVTFNYSDAANPVPSSAPVIKDNYKDIERFVDDYFGRVKKQLDETYAQISPFAFVKADDYGRTGQQQYDRLVTAEQRADFKRRAEKWKYDAMQVDIGNFKGRLRTFYRNMKAKLDSIAQHNTVLVGTPSDNPFTADNMLLIDYSTLQWVLKQSEAQGYDEKYKTGFMNDYMKRKRDYTAYEAKKLDEIETELNGMGLDVFKGPSLQFSNIMKAEDIIAIKSLKINIQDLLKTKPLDLFGK